MITDKGINNYISNQIQMNNEKSQNLLPVKKQSAQSAPKKTDFNNIKSLNDIIHKYIQQTNSNEFYIKYDSSDRWAMCIPIIIGGLMFSIILSVLILGIDDSAMLYFAIFIPGLAFFCGTISFFIQRISLNIFLEENSIRLVYTLNCYCRKTLEIKNEEIREFILEGNNVIKMKYFDSTKKDEIIASRNFYGDEGSYLVYVLNNHLQKLSYNTPGGTTYSNL